MMMPMLAYAKGRKLIPQSFYDLMKICFGAEKCKTVEDFNQAVSFLEAILAYQKYYEK
jgi:CRISPR-associated protein Csm2